MRDFLEKEAAATIKTILPDSKLATQGYITIEGIRCRYKREVSKGKNQSNAIEIFAPIAFSGIGNYNEAIIEAIISLRSKL